jgi:hypothetical protein
MAETNGHGQPELALSTRPSSHIHDGGYARIYRRLFTDGDSIAGSDRRMIGAWIEMFSLAAHEPCELQIGETWIRLERSQLVISLHKLARDWGVPWTTFWRMCKRWEASGRVRLEAVNVNQGRTKGEPRRTRVTICNFDVYQAPPDAAEPRVNQPRTNILTIENQSLGRNGSSYPSLPLVPSTEESSSLRSDSSAGGAADDRGIPERMVEIWNAELGDLLPKPRQITKPRRAQLLARYHDTFEHNLEQWRALCRRVRSAPHLVGDNDRGWRADLDFCLTPSKLLRIIEGRYDPAERRNAGPVLPLGAKRGRDGSTLYPPPYHGETPERWASLAPWRQHMAAWRYDHPELLRTSEETTERERVQRESIHHGPRSMQ